MQTKKEKAAAKREWRATRTRPQATKYAKWNVTPEGEKFRAKFRARWRRS